jgi:hypothetical protein
MRKGSLVWHAALVALATGLVARPAHALALDAQFDCKSDAHTFIESLVTDQYIDPNPMRVEANSVNAFRPIRGRDLTVFGFRVYAVLGYQQDDAMFKKGNGEAASSSIYGAVVSGPAESVKLRVTQAGSDAIVRQVMPLILTAIVCSDH